MVDSSTVTLQRIGLVVAGLAVGGVASYYLDDVVPTAAVFALLFVVLLALDRR